MSLHTVAVFEHAQAMRATRLTAYTRDYSPSWPGICLHRDIEAVNGNAAKKAAMAEHREKCMAARP